MRSADQYIIEHIKHRPNEYLLLYQKRSKYKDCAVISIKSAGFFFLWHVIGEFKAIDHCFDIVLWQLAIQ